MFGKKLKWKQWKIITTCIRCSKANNKLLKSYNPKEESKHSIYLDANNPYGYAMSKLFQQVELVEIDKS